MNLRRKVALGVAALALCLGVLATALAPQTPVTTAGLWCGQSCGSSSLVPPPPPVE